jgi:hypothetical protein
MAKKSGAYKHPSHIVWRRVDKEAVILSLDSSDYFSLNEVGALIWERLGKGEKPDAIQTALCAEFDVPPAKALKDIDALIAELSGKGLLLAA